MLKEDKSFSTPVVSVEYREALEVLKELKKFQYSSCIGRIGKFEFISFYDTSFNTPVVSVECKVYSKTCKDFKCFNTPVVSVESSSIHMPVIPSMFQYSSCIGRIPFNYAEIHNIVKFQYSSCIGRILLFGSVYYILSCFNTPVVSVEYIRFRAF